MHMQGLGSRSSNRRRPPVRLVVADPEGLDFPLRANLPCQLVTRVPPHVVVTVLSAEATAFLARLRCRLRSLALAHVQVCSFACSAPPRRGLCLLYTSPSPRDRTSSRLPSSA